MQNDIRATGRPKYKALEIMKIKNKSKKITSRRRVIKYDILKAAKNVKMDTLEI